MIALACIGGIVAVVAMQTYAGTVASSSAAVTGQVVLGTIAGVSLAQEIWSGWQQSRIAAANRMPPQ